MPPPRHATPRSAEARSSTRRSCAGCALPKASAALAATVGLAATPVAAYNGAAAATWADAHATSYTCWSPGHPTYLPCDDNDCTNFVSIALHYGGGYTEVLGDGFENNVHNWFLTKNGLNLWVQSDTWAYSSGSPNQYQFQQLHIPGGLNEGTATGLAGYSFTGLSPGDLLFYDWGDGHAISHVTMQTTNGTDPKWQGGAQYGSLVDEHSSDRRRVWWTLNPYNPNRNHTTIYFVHISSGN